MLTQVCQVYEQYNTIKQQKIALQKVVNAIMVMKIFRLTHLRFTDTFITLDLIKLHI